MTRSGHIGFAAPLSTPGEATLAALREAIPAGRWLRITYRSPRRVADHDVLPVRLVAADGHWYVDAVSREAAARRRFRTDRIDAPEPIPAPPDADEIVRAAGDGDDHAPEHPEVVFRLTGAGAMRATVHVPDRDLEAEVARQLVEEAGVDLILTYGEDFPLTGETLDADGGNGFIALAESLGYTVITDPADLDGASAERLIGLFPNADGESPVTVDAMLVRALDLLSARETGFFPLVENDDIDSFAHGNDAGLTIAEVVQFDGVVATAIAYAEAAGDTLLLVTADHETGGMAIENPAEADGSESDPFPVAGTDYTFTVGWTTLEHSGVPVPLTAMGPGSDRLVGTYENTAVFGVMCEALGLPIPGAAEGTPVATPAS